MIAEALSPFQQAVKGFAHTVLRALGHRAELASLELAQERLRMLVLLGWFLASAFFGMMALLLVTLAVLFVSWEEHREEAIVITAGAYTLLAALALFRLRSIIRKLPPLMEDTINELKKDGQWIFSENGHTQSAKS
ncbi:MAG: phage holin family protein [Opitutales bacterium]